MVLFFKEAKSKAWRPWDDYVALSLLVSSILSFSEFWSNSFQLNLSFFFPTLLIISHFQFWKESGGRSFALANFFPSFFLVQAFSLVGMAFTSGRVGVLFLALIPCLAAGHFFASFEDERKSLIGKGMILLLLIAFSGLSFFALGNQIVLSYLDFIDMGCFIFWAFGMGHGVLEVYRKMEKKIPQGRDIPGVNRERLFFHDLINHTHGLNLFLNLKIAGKKGLSADEVKNIYDEVRLMQSLIKDHYGYGHKNLTNTYDYVPFEFAKKGIYGLIRTFLPERKVKCEFSFNDFLAPESSEGHSCLIHYPSFHRILTNLVKNISETRSTRVHFVFSYDEEGLHLEVRNRFITLQNDRHTLDKKLANLILEGDHQQTDESGFGIESVHTLCEKEGGRFQFGLEGEEWVSRVFLPSPQAVKKSQPLKAA